MIICGDLNAIAAQIPCYAQAIMAGWGDVGLTLWDQRAAPRTGSTEGSITSWPARPLSRASWPPPFLWDEGIATHAILCKPIFAGLIGISFLARIRAAPLDLRHGQKGLAFF